jgi:hypothetical protein
MAGGAFGCEGVGAGTRWIAARDRWTAREEDDGNEDD